jgi:hypothetical protein
MSQNKLQLKQPIKIKWTGKARKEFETEYADYPKIQKTLNRQKTNIVIKTMEEVEALEWSLDSFGKRYTSRTWEYSGNTKQMGRTALKRRKELKEELKKRFPERVKEVEE